VHGWVMGPSVARGWFRWGLGGLGVRAVLFGALVVGAMACGGDGASGGDDDDDDDDDDAIGSFLPSFGAGSRLVAGGFTSSPTSDRVQVFRTWYDPELDVNCSFQGGPDGSLRCVPVVFTSFNDLFLDENCTERGYQTFNSCAPKFAVGWGERLSCEVFAQDVREVTALEPVPEAVYIGSPDECSLRPLEIDPEDIFLRDDGPLPTSRMVGATVEVVDRPGPIDVEIVQADDGTFQVVGLVAERFGRCFPTRAEDGESRCFPTQAGFVGAAGLFADEECSEPLALYFSPTDDCELPAYIREFDGGVTRLYESVGTFDGTVYTTRRGGCDEFVSEVELALEQGPRVPDADIPSVTVETAALPGEPDAAIGVLANGSEAAGPLQAGVSFGTGDDEECGIFSLEAAPETLVCVPRPRVLQALFGDAECTVPVGVDSATEEAPAHFIETVSSPEPPCSTLAVGVLRAAFVPTGGHEGPIYDGSGDCAETELDPSFAAFTISEVGLDTFREVGVVAPGD